MPLRFAAAIALRAVMGRCVLQFERRPAPTAVTPAPVAERFPRATSSSGAGPPAPDTSADDHDIQQTVAWRPAGTPPTAHAYLSHEPRLTNRTAHGCSGPAHPPGRPPARRTPSGFARGAARGQSGTTSAAMRGSRNGKRRQSVPPAPFRRLGSPKPAVGPRFNATPQDCRRQTGNALGDEARADRPTYAIARSGLGHCASESAGARRRPAALSLTPPAFPSAWPCGSRSRPSAPARGCHRARVRAPSVARAPRPCVPAEIPTR